MSNKMIDRIKEKLKKLGSYLIFLSMILLFISTLRNIGKITQIRKDVETERARVAKIEQEKKDLEKKVREVEGVEFIEQEIRNKLGLVKEGETVVILPDEDVLKRLAPKSEAEEEALPDPNWKKWMKLFI